MTWIKSHRSHSSTTLAANEGLFELTRRPLMTRAVIFTLSKTHILQHLGSSLKTVYYCRGFFFVEIIKELQEKTNIIHFCHEISICNKIEIVTSQMKFPRLRSEFPKLRPNFAKTQFNLSKTQGFTTHCRLFFSAQMHLNPLK